jgi:hypothetical protein
MRGNPDFLAASASLELGMNIKSLAADIATAVMFLAERQRSGADTDEARRADEEELIRILHAVTRLKMIADAIQKGM